MKLWNWANAVTNKSRTAKGTGLLDMLARANEQSLEATGMGNMAYAHTLQEAGGAMAFVVCLLGWYLFTALMLASVDAPFSLPGKFQSRHGLC